MQEIIYPITTRSFESWLLKVVHVYEREGSLRSHAGEVTKIGEIEVFSKFDCFPEEVIVVKSKDGHLRTSILPKLLIRQLLKEKSSVIPIVSNNNIKMMDSSGDSLITDLYLPKRVRQNIIEAEFDSSADPDYILISTKLAGDYFDEANSLYYEAVHFKENNSMLYRAFSHQRCISIENGELCLRAVNSPTVYVKKLNEIDYELRSEIPGTLTIQGALTKIRLDEIPFPHFIFSFNSCMIQEEELNDVEVPSTTLYVNEKPFTSEDIWEKILPYVYEKMKKRKDIRDDLSEMSEEELEFTDEDLKEFQSLNSEDEEDDDFS